MYWHNYRYIKLKLHIPTSITYITISHILPVYIIILHILSNILHMLSVSQIHHSCTTLTRPRSAQTVDTYLILTTNPEVQHFKISHRATIETRMFCLRHKNVWVRKVERALCGTHKRFRLISIFFLVFSQNVRLMMESVSTHDAGNLVKEITMFAEKN